MQLNALAAIESDSGAVMDPYKLANELLDYCARKGMKIFDQTEVGKIKSKKRITICDDHK